MADEKLESGSRSGSFEAIDLKARMKQLALDIQGLPLPEQLRLAADLLEQEQHDLALQLVVHVEAEMVEAVSGESGWTLEAIFQLGGGVQPVTAAPAAEEEKTG
jgi:hypothetical protein